MGVYYRRAHRARMRETVSGKLRPLSLLVALGTLLAACQVATGALLPAVQAPVPLVTADPLATPTPTAFIPLVPTTTPEAPLTPEPTPIPTVDFSRPWGDFPGPVEPSALEIPPPAPRLNLPPEVVNVVLLGSDARPYEGGYRTDVIMILSLDPTRGRATVISIPRDLYVYIPGWRIDRINTADPRGKFDMLSLTILYNFGIPVHHWARVNFQGFVAAVDALGGIDVQVTRYVQDRCGDVVYTYAPGVYHMDGWTALCYVRMRKFTSDFDRLRREQEVIEAIFRKVVSLDGLSRVPELYNQFRNTVQTDMTLEDLLPLVPLAATLAQDPGRIQHITIDQSMATPWRVPYSGAAVLLPDRERILATLRAALEP